MAINIHCSQLPRIMACPASTQEPKVKVHSSSDAANMGTAVHDVMQTIVKENLFKVPDVWPAAERHGITEEGEVKELAILCGMALKVLNELREETEELIACEDQFDASLGDSQLVGTPDAVYHTKDHKTLIIDFKSGRIERDYRHQLMGYGYVVSMERNLLWSDMVFVTVHVREQNYDVFEVAELEGQKWQLEYMKAIKGEDYNPGPACEFCPLAHECEGRQAMLRVTTMEIMASEQFQDDYKDPKYLATMYPRVQMLKQGLKRYDEMLKHALQGTEAIPMGDGRSITYEDTKRDNIYLLAAGPTLGKLLGTETLKELLQRLGPKAVKVTKKSILDAVSRDAPRGHKGIEKEKAMIALHEAGAVDVTESKKITIRKELPSDGK